MLQDYGFGPLAMPNCSQRLRSLFKEPNVFQTQILRTQVYRQIYRVL